MYRAIPKSNKLLDDKWNKKRMELHKQRLKSMKPTVETYHRGAHLKHLLRNTKREQMFEDRCTEIERENRILLEKMTQIMQFHKTTYRPTRPIVEKRSLNREARKKALIKIAQENQAILKRLQEKQPSYQTGHFQEDYRNKMRLLRNICEYPLVFSKDRRELSDSSERAATAYNEKDMKTFQRPRVQTGNSDGPSQMHTISNPRRTEPFNPKHILESPRTILYKAKRKLTPGEYLVELSIFNEKMYIIAVDVVNPETLLVEIPEEKVNQLMMSFNNDFECLVQSIDILNKKLVVMKPKETATELPKIPEKAKA